MANRKTRATTSKASKEGWAGWDAYAPFYDWENLRTFGRRDVAFWRDTIAGERGPVLELGCGTGRLLMPLSRGRATVIGIDRSQPMLERAAARARRRPRQTRPGVIRGDVRALPFGPAGFGVVLAPYGLLQSLLSDRDLDRALAEAGRVLTPGGLLGIDLVPELPEWAEYGPRVRLRGRGPDGAVMTLVESVRQDRRRGRTIFHETFVVRRGRATRRRRFTLTFRTQPMARMLARLDRAGFEVGALFSDYEGAPWDARADTWLILARKQ
jgi:SAM-dependent methyltransferase